MGNFALHHDNKLRPDDYQMGRYRLRLSRRSTSCFSFSSLSGEPTSLGRFPVVWLAVSIARPSLMLFGRASRKSVASTPGAEHAVQRPFCYTSTTTSVSRHLVQANAKQPAEESLTRPYSLLGGPSRRTFSERRRSFSPTKPEKGNHFVTDR